MALATTVISKKEKEYNRNRCKKKQSYDHGTWLTGFRTGRVIPESLKLRSRHRLFSCSICDSRVILSPTNQSIVSWDSFFLSSSLPKLYLPNVHHTMSLYTEHALEDIFVISASFIFCLCAFLVWLHVLELFFWLYKLIYHVARKKKNWYFFLNCKFHPCLVKPCDFIQSWWIMNVITKNNNYIIKMILSPTILHVFWGFKRLK